MFSDVYSVMVAFVSAHANYAYAVVFLLAFSEAIPVVGSFVPGSTGVVAVSAIATAAGADPWLLLAGAIAGAIAGDGASFWLGHRFSREILGSWPLVRYPHFVAQSERFIARFGVYSVFLARFMAVIRAFVPLIAGILEMRPLHFYVANVLSAIVWAPAHVFPGIVVVMLVRFTHASVEQRAILIAVALIVFTVVGLVTHRWLKATGHEQEAGSNDL